LESLMSGSQDVGFWILIRIYIYRLRIKNEKSSRTSIPWTYTTTSYACYIPFLASLVI